MSELTGTIFDIKRFAVHDGPGIRTTVFFKGCPLRCLWCHNPESMKIQKQIVFFENKCIGCGECFKRCPSGALEATPEGRVYYRAKCKLCGTCVEYCYAEATVMEGKTVTVQEVIDEVKKDMPFYENSGGGVTLSGGEPTFQPDFCLAVLKASKEEGMHTTLDTSGCVKWDTLEKILEYVDLVLYDMKHMNPDKHKEFTGVPNELILSNLKKMDQLSIPIEIRMPTIPELNDSQENLQALAEFLSELKNVKRIKLLPYHRLGEGKYERLDMDYRLKDLQPPSKERMKEITDFMRDRISERIEVISG
ncbi:glycyl-radical enzyme activating protein [Candidatus Poribacteria bacterium]|nr:glycyl-radical enzyme activating protein [Candidatus Poribacteria bacterium]